MPSDQLTASEYLMRGLTPGQAQFAASLRLSEPTPVMIPPAPPDPRQQPPLTVSDYLTRGYTPGQAQFAANLRLPERTPVVFPPAPPDPQQQARSQESQVAALQVESDRAQQHYQSLMEACNSARREGRQNELRDLRQELARYALGINAKLAELARAKAQLKNR